MGVIEHTFSEFLRQPKQVIKDLEAGDVVLRRREAPSLRLTEADRAERRDDAYAMVGRTLRSLATHSPDALRNAMSDAFPWMTFLPEPDRDEFLDDFTRTAAAVAEIENFGPLAQLIREWQATAAIHADPELARRLRTPVEALDLPVPEPSH